MSDPRPPDAGGSQPGAPVKPATSVASLPQSRGFLSSLLYRTFGRTGAQIGAVWVVVLVLAAVFAPLLANSHPIVWKHNGEVSSPLLKYLTAVDVTLFGSFLAAVGVLLLRRVPAGSRVAGWLWLTAVVTVAAVSPTVQRWYEQQFQNDADGAGLRMMMLVIGGLVTLAVLVLVPWCTRGSGAKLWVPLGVAAVVLAGGISAANILPPQAIVLSQYREAEAKGEVEWAVMTPLAYSPIDRQRDVRSATGLDPRLLKPSWTHPMGTTEAGADLASRMIYACRIALAIGLIATGIAVVIGVSVGAVMGYFAGRVDLLGMRFVEVFSAIPVIFLLIMIVAFYGRDLFLIMVVLGLTGWVGYALFVRAEFLKLRNMDYVMAARATGAPLWSILFKHILPNGLTPVLVLVPFGIASAILYESTLSFLGLGLVDQPSWGQALQEARQSGLHQWGLLVYPGLAIFLTVLAYNLIGEAIRDALDPKSAKR